MKLTDLGLTPTGIKATKKLTHQVHKATVAAGYDPKLKLGVLGIEIGQEQSTGLTSRVNEEAAAVTNVFNTLKKLALYLKSEDLPSRNIDDEGMWEDAASFVVSELKKHKEDSEEFRASLQYLSNIMYYMHELSDNFSRAARQNEQVLNKNLEYPTTSSRLPDWMKAVDELNTSCIDWGFSLKEFSKAVYHINGFLGNVRNLKRGDDGFNVANATLIKLELRERPAQPE